MRKRVVLNTPNSSGLVSMSDAHLYFASRQVMEYDVARSLGELQKLTPTKGVKVILDDPSVSLHQAEMLVRWSQKADFILLVNRQLPEVSASDFEDFADCLAA